MSFFGSTVKPVLRHRAISAPTHLFVMASSTSSINPADLESFSKHLRNSDRILALCGAGLSAASGLPTFRGAGGLWRSNDAISLATPEAFRRNPGLVWQFYSYRRHMALQARPNAGHYALSELAARKKGFLTLSQNVDGVYKDSRCQLPAKNNFQDSVNVHNIFLPSFTNCTAPCSMSSALPSIVIIKNPTISQIQWYRH